MKEKLVHIKVETPSLISGKRNESSELAFDVVSTRADHEEQTERKRLCGCSCSFDVLSRGSGELALPVWQPRLQCAAVPSELPDWSQRRQRCAAPLSPSQCDDYVSARGWRLMGGIFPPLFLCQRRATTFWWPAPLRWPWFTGQILPAHVS